MLLALSVNTWELVRRRFNDGISLNRIVSIYLFASASKGFFFFRSLIHMLLILLFKITLLP